jgi:hypothetical protein
MVVVKLGRRDVRGNVLNQRAPSKHIKALSAKTDSEHRQKGLVRVPEQREVERVAVGNHLPETRVRRLTVTCRIDIARTAGKKDAIEPCQVPVQYFG